MRTYIALTLAALVATAAIPASGAATRGAGGLIAFAMGNGRNLDLYTVRSDGSGLKRLTTAPGWDGCPAFARGGQQLAFCSDRSGGPQIWLMNVDGSGQRQVTQSRYAAYFPSLSPDGKRIAFQANDGSPAADDIYVVAVAGGKIVRFTGAPGNDDFPAFSPDGRWIAFVSHRKLGPAQIWLMNASNGHDQQQLTHDKVAKDELPAWSRDGERIAYSAGGDIWVMNADGTNETKLTSGAPFDVAPTWSPDGSQIAFDRIVGPSKQIYVTNADGTGAHALVANHIRQLLPAWQP